MRQLIVSALLLSVIAAASAAAKPADRDFVYKTNGKRDPFVPLVSNDGKILPGAKTGTESERVDLEGVIWDPKGKSVAIINGKLVKEQDRVFDFQVLKIKKDSIILQREGKVVIVNLKKGGGKENE